MQKNGQRERKYSPENKSIPMNLLNKVFFVGFFLLWLFVQIPVILKFVNRKAATTMEDSEKVISGKSSMTKAEDKQSLSDGNEADSVWGLCNPFESPVYVERAPIPELSMTMFFLGCSFNESIQNISLTVFMEPDPPMLPVVIGKLHAEQSDKWNLARVAVRVANNDFVCDPPVWRASAISTFNCAPQVPYKGRNVFTGSKAKAYIWVGSKEAMNKNPAEIEICRKGPIKKEVALCMPYLPTAGPDWSTYIRQYIEYHKLAGVNSITMFDHTTKYERLIETYYRNDESVVRVHWPPLSSRPDKVITELKYSNVTIVRECYDQTLLTTYYMANTDYAWVMVLDSDEYFWDEDFVVSGKKEGTGENEINYKVSSKEEIHKKRIYGSSSKMMRNKAERSPLFERLENIGKNHSCIGLETVVLLSNKTRTRPYGDQSGIVIEDNDWVCPLKSYLKVACRPNEVYGMEVHVGMTKRGRKYSQSLKNLHIKNVWMPRVEADLVKCNNTDRYYKPFSKDLRKALQVKASDG